MSKMFVSVTAFLTLGFLQPAFSQAIPTLTAAQTVEQLKSQILTLAQSYQGQSDPDGSKKHSLDVLIDQLVAATPAKSMEEKATNAIGAWQQIWGPYAYNNSVTVLPKLDPNSIFQVISPTGFYTNVGIYNVLGLKIIGLLKGQYTVEANQIAVQFVEDGVLAQPVPKGYTLADLPALHEDHEILVVDFPSIFPPVGIRGDLIETYSDADLRITYGEQEGQAGQTLYVLQRVKALNY